jgi:predicted nuclease of predicted toxin-antitoxin system
VRLLADMGVSRRVTDGLRNDGHDTVHLRDLGLHRMLDPDIFLKAKSEGRVVLTFDLDFARIAAVDQAPASVVLFRLFDASSARVLALARRALGEFGQELAAGALVVAEDTRLRVRRYPIRGE